MLFNSLHFFLFFPIVFFSYFFLAPRHRTVFLLLASCYFYMAFIPKYILILFLLIGIDYVMGLKIEQETSLSQKKKYFFISIFFNIGILFLFKYFNFFNQNISEIAQFFHWNYGLPALSLILPIGLSFHTFQSLSYIIEVYRGKQKAEKNIWVYALYVLFFPQLVAGPIERPQNILPQLHETKFFDATRAVSGLRLMLWGFFKKIVIADNIALLVSTVYGTPTSKESAALVVATILFAFQIYCDFSGYSDIARGTARILGYRLMKNFDSPYFSCTISEFWKRWHISLSSWFRDYVYIPLGGNRQGTAKTVRNLALTFCISGLWHGANWTFIAWGALHAFYLGVSFLTKKIREQLWQTWVLRRVHFVKKYFQILCTFVLVDIGWIFFRADSFGEALYIFKKIPAGIQSIVFHFFEKSFLQKLFADLSIQPMTFILLLISIGVLLLVESRFSQKWLTNWSHFPRIVRYGVYYAVILWIFFIGYFGEVPFIYFQF